MEIIVAKAVNLAKSISNNVPNIFLDIGFKAVLEQHMVAIRRDPGNTDVDVTPHESDYYQGNFHGLLYKKAVPVELHWLVTRMNGYDSSISFKGDISRIYLPNMERINRLKEIYMTIHNM